MTSPNGTAIVFLEPKVELDETHNTRMSKDEIKELLAIVEECKSEILAS